MNDISIGSVDTIKKDIRTALDELDKQGIVSEEDSKINIIQLYNTSLSSSTNWGKMVFRRTMVF